MVINKILDNLSQFEIEKLCNLLECDKDELARLYESAKKVYNDSETIYDRLLKILQQGNNVREATLIGLLCGKLIGFSEAEQKIERDIKDKLFNAFKKNRPF
tara:strand:- start:2088 stop:2393 length:306 start_codon:yes stop_codon:yes gene_type:complete